MKHYLLALVAAISICAAQTPPPVWAFTPDPKLPNVLIIGNTPISIGYTRNVRDLLRTKANVYRPVTPDFKGAINCANTAFGLAQLSNGRHYQMGRHPFQLGTPRPLLPEPGIQRAGQPRQGPRCPGRTLAQR